MGRIPRWYALVGAFVSTIGQCPGAAAACDGIVCAKVVEPPFKKKITVQWNERSKKLYYRVERGPKASESQEVEVYLVCRGAFSIGSDVCSKKHLRKKFHQLSNLKGEEAFNLVDFRKPYRSKLIVTVGAAEAKGGELDQLLVLNHEDTREMIIIYKPKPNSQ